MQASLSAIVSEKPANSETAQLDEICGKRVDASKIDAASLFNSEISRLIDLGVPMASPTNANAVGTFVRTPIETCLINATNAEFARIYDEVEKMRTQAMAELTGIAEIPPEQLRKMEASMALANDDMRQNYVNFPLRNLTPEELDHLRETIIMLRNPDLAGRMHREYCQKFATGPRPLECS